MSGKKLVRLNRKSVVITWLGSYIVVLLIPILFSLAVYWQAEKTIKHRIQEDDRLLLLQIQETFDNQIDSIKRMTAQIYSNPILQDLFYSNKFSRGQYEYDLYQITRDLKVFKNTYNAFEEFYIYWAPADLAILSSVYKAGNLLYESLYQGGNTNLEQWRRMVQTPHSQQIVMTNRKEGQENKMYINYVSSLPTDDNKNPVGSIVTMMNTKQLFQMISNVKALNESEVIILNEQNQSLVSNLSSTELPVGTNRLVAESGYFEDSYLGKASQFSYIKSKNSGLTYLIVSPVHLVWKEANDVRTLIYWSIAFSIAAGILLTIVFLRRSYKPLHKLLQATSQQSSRVMEPGVNEYQFIQRVMLTTWDEKEQSQLRLRQQHRQLRSNFLSRLLKGRLETGISEDEAVAAFQLPFVSDQFCVMLVYVEDNESFFETIGGKSDEEKLRLLQFIVANVAEDLVNQHYRCVMAEVDDMMAGLINLDTQQNEETMSDFVRIAEEVKQFLKMKFHIDITIAFSAVHSSWAGIAAGYKEALTAMEYKLVIGKGKIIVYEKLQLKVWSHFKDGYYYPIQVEQKWINCIKVGDLIEARHILDEIMERNFRLSSLSVELTKCLVFDLVSTLLKTMQEIRNVHGPAMPHRAGAIESIIAAETVDEIRTRFSVVLEELCTYTAALHERSKTKLRHDEMTEFTQSILRFVENNLHNCNLNVSYIGEHFDMKATYLSKLFKDQTGDSLLEHIGRCRVEKAKRLLREQKLSLGEVASMCGFGELKTFIRTFKKLEGITPVKYKALE